MTTLPTYVPELIRLAVDDFRKTLADPAYFVNMGFWHSRPMYKRDGPCHVCLAGSVLAQRADIRVDDVAFPCDFPESRRQLRALDLLRTGNLAPAASMLGQNVPDNLPDNVTMPAYNNINPNEFINAMLALADRWEQAQTI